MKVATKTKHHYLALPARHIDGDPNGSMGSMPWVSELDVITERMPDRLRVAVLIAAWCAVRFGTSQSALASQWHFIPDMGSRLDISDDGSHR